MLGSKCADDEFSTNENVNQSRRKNSYSSRYQMSRAKSIIPKRANHPQFLLPSIKEKAALLIQKNWRAFLLKRRKYYQQLLSSLLINNQVTANLLDKKTKYLKSIQNFNQINQALANNKISAKIGHKRLQMKELAKECVRISFKYQKKMLEENELRKLSYQVFQAKKRVGELEMEKQRIHSELFDDGSARKDEFLLREIKEANMKLLQIVSEKNKLKHELHERQKKNRSQYEINQN